MKKLLLPFLLSIGFFANAQIQFTNYSNHLLIGPESASEISPEVIVYYLTDYQKLQEELEEKQFRSTPKEKEAIAADLEKIESMIDLWTVEQDEYPIIDFIADYDSSNCYRIETENGFLDADAFQIIENEALSSNILKETIQVEKYKKKPEFKKIEMPQRHMQNSEEETTWCRTKGMAKYVLTTNDEPLDIFELPTNFEYQESENLLVNQKGLPSFPYQIVDTQTDKAIDILSWEIVDCQ